MKKTGAKAKAILLVLAGVGLVSCARKESSRQETKVAAPAAAADVSLQPAALLPGGDEVPGWRMAQGARSFKAENLWEYIDGAADAYLAFGFGEVVSAEYSEERADRQVVIDIYQMGSPLGAFGIYAQERSPEYHFLKIGNEGYLTGTTLNFWTGSFYVKITAFGEKDALRPAMTKLAAAVAAKVAAPGAEPAETTYFPKANRLPRSVTYVPRDVLAQSYFTSGFEAKYKAGDQEYRMILVTLESPKAAEDALARYRQFLSRESRPVYDVATPGQGGFSGKDSFYGNVVAVRSGRNIAVVLGIRFADEGKRLVAELVENIR